MTSSGFIQQLPGAARASIFEASRSHHKPFDCVDIELQVIVDAPCDQAPRPSPHVVSLQLDRCTEALILVVLRSAGDNNMWAFFKFASVSEAVK